MHLKYKLFSLQQNSKSNSPTTNSTFDYLYEFSETRKVLEEFFKCPPPDEESRIKVEFQDLEYELRRHEKNSGNSYVGQRLAKVRPDGSQIFLRIESPRKFISTTNFTGLHHQVKFDNLTFFLIVLNLKKIIF